MTIEQIKTSGKPLCLIGMMGAGKTHVGQALAQIMGVEFIDTDAVIEQATGQTIAQIFSNQGEPAFRTLESETIRALIKANPAAIIATGGGCITTPSVREALANQAHTCWLQATPEAIYARIKDDTARPLLQTKNPLQTLTELSAAREQHYKQAHIHTSTESEDPAAIAHDIINQLSAHLNATKN